MSPILALLLLSAFIFDEGSRDVTTITEKDLPSTVRQASKRDTPKGAKVIGFEKLTEKGETFFEVKIEVNGKDQELLYRADGTLYLREEETEIDQIPSGARAAIQKAATGGRIRKVDVIRKSGLVLYEGELLIDGQKSKVIFDAQGKPAGS